MKNKTRLAITKTTTSPIRMKIIVTVLDFSVGFSSVSGAVYRPVTSSGFSSVISFPASLTVTLGFSITGAGLGSPDILKLAILGPILITKMC